jgi:hypothetical protein
MHQSQAKPYSPLEAGTVSCLANLFSVELKESIEQKNWNYSFRRPTKHDASQKRPFDKYNSAMLNPTKYEQLVASQRVGFMEFTGPPAKPKRWFPRSALQYAHTLGSTMGHSALAWPIAS